MANFTSIQQHNSQNNQQIPDHSQNCNYKANATLPEASPVQMSSAEGDSGLLGLAYQSIPVYFMSQEQSPINHLLPSAFELYEAESRPLPFLRLSSSASDSYNYFSSE